MKIDVLSTIVDKIKKGNNVHQHLDLIAGLPYEGYDRRQMRKMTHLERIDGKTVLFDYKNRDPLTGNAAIYYLSE